MVDIPTVPISDADDEDSFSVIKLAKLAAHHKLLLDDLQGIENGSIPNLMVLMPPGSAKSTYSDIVFIPWFMSRKPRRNVILASYASEIAEKQGRRARQLIKTPSFQNIMGVGLRQDNKAAHQWTLENGSEFMAGGLLSGLTGNRGALGVVDDPMKGRAEAESETIRDKTWSAYIDDFCSRLVPGAPQVMIQCMVGDTPVLMGDGSEKSLSEVRPGDVVATYRNGILSTAAVLNWASQGHDSVFRIKTKSGKLVEANERHPFLVERNGERQWLKVRELKVGERILRVTGGSTEGSTAPKMAALSPRRAQDCADRTTTNSDGRKASGLRLLSKIRRLASAPSLSTVTASILMTTKQFWRANVAFAQFASGLRKTPATLAIGVTSFASITATNQEKSEDCSATTATSPSAEARPQKFLNQPHDTSAFILDEVISIEPAGVEEVFDIQVAETENFIANGLVSHNTRWHEEDLAGRILPVGWDGESGFFDGRDGRKWKVICLPAIADRRDDPLGRKIGETLWPEWFSLEHWKPFQQNPRTWSSLYQQKPSPPNGTFFQRDWFRRYRKGDEPTHLHKYMTSDHAPGGGAINDFSGARMWGIDPSGDIYMLDGFRNQETMDKTVDKALDLVRKHQPFAWFPEDDNNWKTVHPFVTLRMAERSTFVRIEPISPHGASKPVKAGPFQAMASMRRVWIPEGLEGDEVIDQYLKFPTGKNDDEVDLAALIGKAIDMAHPAIVPRKEIKEPFEDRWFRKFERDQMAEEEDWKTA